MSEKQKVIIEPSILAADYTRLGEQAREAEIAGAEALQIDVMDGHFVPNLTFGPGIVQALRPLVRLKLDVHLMIENPDAFLRVFAQAGADQLIVHQEVCPDLPRTLQAIRALGIKAGIAIKPGTSESFLPDVLRLADVIQVMTVPPGFGGQDFLPAELGKIGRIRKMLHELELPVPIAVDGGIDEQTAPLVVAAGATVLIAGSAIFNRHASIRDNIISLQAAAARGKSAA
jgi:ribulose-phosphate 3-epimerase